MSNVNIEMIKFAAKALTGLNEDFVFVGGSVVPLYLDLETSEEIRPTEDVDIILEVLSLVEFDKLTRKLISLGFKPDTSDSAPLCRWKYQGATIDIMPLNEKILGFSNRFYKEGFKRKVIKKLSNGVVVSILPLPYFLASKLEAFNNRGKDDPRFSNDLEDITSLLTEGGNFSKIFGCTEINEFLTLNLASIFKNPLSLEAIRSFLINKPKGTYQLLSENLQSFHIKIV